MSKASAVIIIVIVVAALFMASTLGYLDTLASILTPDSEPSETETGYSMQVSSQLDNWVQISDTSQSAEYTFNVKVINTAISDPTQATVDYQIEDETKIVKTGSIDFGIINEDQEKTINQTYTLNEGTYQAIFILRASEKEWANFTDQFKVDIPRRGMGEHVRFYITPYNPSVQTQLLTIGDDLNTIYSWVGENIIYEFDSDINGVADYWQFPHETLDLKTGDCEDQAFLLASLVRATGVEAEDIFVALGMVNNQGHAWVIIRTQIGWRVLEPTADGITNRVLTDIFEFLNLEGRNYYFASNDQYFEEINPGNNRSFITQEFTGWYKNGVKLEGTRINVTVNQPIKLTTNVTNTGNHTYLGFIQIKIQRDIVMAPDTTLATTIYPLTLYPNASQQIELNFTPDELTEDTFLKCRQYYYQVSTCFSTIHDPQDEATRECIFTTP
ncbi:MAG: transglutaminase domain-containing protein [Candidatus Bathyarchaeota archaeon]